MPSTPFESILPSALGPLLQRCMSLSTTSEAWLSLLSFVFAILLVHLVLKKFLHQSEDKKIRIIEHSVPLQNAGIVHKKHISTKGMVVSGLFPRTTSSPSAPISFTDGTAQQNSEHKVPRSTSLKSTKRKPRNWMVKQPYDAFLVLDVEATCMQGTDFSWPNEIIEWPVCLLRWQDKDKEGRASKLSPVEEFRSFVQPTWRPHLSEFCTTLTGITQADVECAPKFPKVLEAFSKFLAKHGLIDGQTGKQLQRFTWCTDGPFDIRDFVVKQCFISKITMPDWLKVDVLDVRKSVGVWLALQSVTGESSSTSPTVVPRRLSLNISQQLSALELPAFEGRQHSGIDDTRNIARIVTELARRGVKLEPNTTILPGRRWQWMGKPGQILEEYCLT